MGEDL